MVEKIDYKYIMYLISLNHINNVIVKSVRLECGRFGFDPRLGHTKEYSGPMRGGSDCTSVGGPES